jgi:hypothetical protein
MAHPNYDLIELDGEEFWCIKIKSGDYADVIYKYDYVRFIEPKSDDDYATLKFNYEVLYHAELPEDKFAKNPAFENMLGDILHDLISTAPEPDKQ